MLLRFVEQMVMKGSVNIGRAFNDGWAKVLVGQGNDEILVALELS